MPNPIDEVWEQVQKWPAAQRRALLAKLQALENVPRLADLIGAWKTDHPPSEDDVERILDEERMRKYG